MSPPFPQSELADLAKKHSNLHNTYVYSQPSSTETLEKVRTKLHNLKTPKSEISLNA